MGLCCQRGRPWATTSIGEFVDNVLGKQDNRNILMLLRIDTMQTSILTSLPDRRRSGERATKDADDRRPTDPSTITG